MGPGRDKSTPGRPDGTGKKEPGGKIKPTPVRVDPIRIVHMARKTPMKSAILVGICSLLMLSGCRWVHLLTPPKTPECMKDSDLDCQVPSWAQCLSREDCGPGHACWDFQCEILD